MRHKKINYNYSAHKRVIPTILVVGVFLLTGCTSINYTTEQEDAIANYAADIVLKHDVNHSAERMGEYETTTAAEVTTEQITTDANSDIDSNNNGSTDAISSAGDITNALQVNGLNAEYIDYDVTDQYPEKQAENNVFVMKAVENSKLLVVKFKLTNETGQDISINMMSDNRKYKGTVNNAKKYNAQLTLLTDALNTYEGTITNGTSQELVLVFQTQLDSKDDVKNLSVSITDANGKESELNLK